MEVQEHFYADDPSRGPADAKTTLRGAEYFFLGNGFIQAAVQIAPAGDGTPVGLLIMDPERLGPKRAALSFDKDTGIAATGVSIEARGDGHAPRPGSVRAAWRRGNGRSPRRSRLEKRPLPCHGAFLLPGHEVRAAAAPSERVPVGDRAPPGSA